MCPQKQSQCGTDQNIEFAKEDEKKDITVTGLVAGDSCSYKVKAKCGAPGFKVKDETTANDDKLNVSFMEYQNDKMQTSGQTTNTASDIPQRKTGRPADDMPPRDQTFESTGNQGKYNGQEQPPRKNKGSGKM